MRFLLFATLLLSLSFQVNAQKSEVFQKDGAAIRGYDPVAFFQQQKPVKGLPEFTTIWKSASWYFTSQANKDAFIQSPETFAPQYGGYCAYGTAAGHKAPTDIDTWTIVDGKLYFNYNNKVKEAWGKDTNGYIEKADVQWPVIKDKE